MTVRQILVIDPAVNIAEIECYNNISLISPLTTTYHLPAFYGLQSLHAIDMATVAGIIILGSASSVNERLPWQSMFEAWIKPNLENWIPTLGICYGHQMLAHLYGGAVDYIFSDQKKISAMRCINIEKLPWFKSTLGSIAVSHNEMITRMPDCFNVIATSRECNTDGMAHNRLPIWSFQSHPEATKEFLSNHQIEISAPDQQLQFGQGLLKKFLEYASTFHRNQ